MIELNIKDNATHQRRKIPLLIFLLMILGGIFLFILFLFNYHFDSIDDFVNEDVNVYSHWKIKKIFQQESANLDKIIESASENKNFPDNFKEKLMNSSEFAIIQAEKQWIFIFKPTDFNIFSKSLKYNSYAIESTENVSIVKTVIDENQPLSNNHTYRTKKRFDFSKANIYIKDYSDLPYFNENMLILDEETFWKIQIENDFTKLSAKQLKNPNNCKNNIQIPDFSNYQYYINNLSTSNNNLTKIPFLANTNTCIDLLINDEDNWLVLAPKTAENTIKNSIIDHLAYKYPKKQTKRLVDGSISTQIIADRTVYNWQENENGSLSISHQNEKYYLRLYDQNFIQLSNIDHTLSFSDQIKYEKCGLTTLNKNGQNNIIYINDPSRFIFENILINRSTDRIAICIH